MMKMKQIYLFLSLALLCACSSDEELPAVAQQPCPALELTVSAGGFITDSSASGTRATDNGAATTFENGDRVGVIVLEDGTLKGNNLPYKYNGGSWSFDAATVNSEGTGKSVYYYDNKATNVTYIVYFPYSTDANDVTSIEGDGGLKSKFIPKADQQSEADYRASDLMIWQSTAGIAPQKTLAATLTHAYNSVSLLPEVHYTLDNGDDFVHPSPAISDVNFLMDDEIVYPYKAADGSYRCILRSGLTNSSVRCFYTCDNKTYSKDLTVSLAGANTRYSSTQRVNAGSYSLANAQVGDFYCKNNSNEGYLIPGEIASLTANQQAACLGIVLKVGKDDSGDWKDEDIYKLKDGTTEMGIIHGYVLALKDGNSGNTCAWGSYGEEIHTDQAQYTLFCGYSNTQKIKEYVAANAGKTLQKDFPAAYYASEGYEQSYPSPSNSSGWFLPSAGQCWYWYKNRDLLLTSMQKVGGNGWQSYYWSSSESDYYPAGYAWYVGFDGGYVYDDRKRDRNNRRVRSSLAF